MVNVFHCLLEVCVYFYFLWPHVLFMGMNFQLPYSNQHCFSIIYMNIDTKTDSIASKILQYIKRVWDLLMLEFCENSACVHSSLFWESEYSSTVLIVRSANSCFSHRAQPAAESNTFPSMELFLSI
jgi:hypothetical protein